MIREGKESGDGLTLSLDFDGPGYEGARLEGLEAFREFRQMAASKDVREQEWERDPASVEEQLKALALLPGPTADLPLRALAAIGGNLTWGALEGFYNWPMLPESETPASRRLRHWYRDNRVAFETFFPEHRAWQPDGSGDVELSAFNGFWNSVQEVAERHAAARERPLDRALLFGVLLRDYAPWLQTLAFSFDFSISALIRRSLVEEPAPRDFTQAAWLYEEMEELAEGPTRMFAALVVPGVDEIGFQLPRNDLVAAIANLDAAGETKPRGEPAIQGHANSDLPTRRDRIGVQPLVEGLRALLDDERTGLSLSIGITAPWGGGKSSVMLQLREALTRSEATRTREWIPIRFDAWKHEGSEQLWAALSKAIYEQSLEQMNSWGRTRFKFGLERERRGRLSFWVVPLALLIALVAFGVLLAFEVSVAAGVLTVLATILGFGGFAGKIWGLLSDPFKRALDGYVSDVGYEERLGFTSEADDDIRRLTEKLTGTGNRALIVFVDDLDRCSPGHVVEAVEAINQIFNASEESRCVFILGMDREIVAAAIEVAYGETIDKLSPERKRNFGLHFLAKVVQLSVAVPAPEPEGIERLLEAIAAPAEQASAELGTGSRRLEIRLGPLAMEAGSEAVDGEASNFEPSVAPQKASGARLPEIQAVDESSPEFHQAERLAAAYLPPNPREVKRFDNAFRLQLQVARRTPECRLNFGEDDLIAVGSWVALRLRWPDLATAVDKDPALLERLEMAANDGRPEGIQLVEDQNGRPSWESDPDLMRLLEERDPARRIARLQEPGFLRIS